MVSLSKNKIKYIRSLELKKTRKEEGVFLAETPKLVEELLQYFHCRFLAATPAWLQAHGALIKTVDEISEVSDKELLQASLQKAPQEVLAVFEQPKHVLQRHVPEHALCLALDDVQDPGNMGTIIRIADWYGIEHIICSTQTVDVYNPKVVQASMGAIARVKVHYTSLPAFMDSLSGIPIYGTFLDGENIYHQSLANHGLIVMGNEGNGIRPDTAAHVNRRLYIPNYPQGRKGSESLNVAVATAIVCAEFRRQAAWL